MLDTDKNELPELPQSQTVQQQEYFGFSKTDTFLFPDGVTYFEIKAMNEGEKSEYQRMTQKDITLERQSGNARLRVDQSTDRHELIKTCTTGWNLVRGGAVLQFTKPAMRDFLLLADPALVQDIESAIRKINPWMNGEATVEEIDKAIEELQEQRKAAVEREAGK